MRTTVDLPPAVHQRARELAERNHASLSATLSDLVIRGLADQATPIRLSTDPRTGLPVFDLDRPITAQEVSDFLDEDYE